MLEFLDPEDEWEDDDDFDEDDELDEFDLDADLEELEWDTTEYAIQKWIEETLDADHIGWSEVDLTTQPTPEFDTEAEVSKVLDTLPLGYQKLKDSSSYLIEAADGAIIVFFDDKPTGTAITPEEYKHGIDAKLGDIEEIIGDGWTRTVNIIDEDNTTRVAWVGAASEDDDDDDDDDGIEDYEE